MRRLPQGIIFAAQFVGEAQIFDYRLRVTTTDGQTFELDDPYRYGQVMGELDLHLLGEGRHYRAFERLGSHALKIGVGDRHLLRGVGAERRARQRGRRLQPLARPRPSDAPAVPNGIWELFVPGLGAGERYKYELRGKARSHAVPQGRSLRARVRDAAGHGGADQRRAALPLARRRLGAGAARPRTATSPAPVSIYEVHLGSWARVAEDGNRSLSYRELADAARRRT